MPPSYRRSASVLKPENKKPAPAMRSQSFSAVVPYGDGRISPVQWVGLAGTSQSKGPQTTTACKSSSSKAFTFNAYSVSGWQVKLVYICVLLSWITALSASHSTKRALAEMKGKDGALSIQLAEQSEKIRKLRIDTKAAKKYIKKLKQTRAALEHEVLVMREIGSEDINVSPTPSSEDGVELVVSWLKHRQHSLYQKVSNLKTRLASVSRNSIVQKYGEGPHLVRFTVEFKNPSKLKVNKHFDVQMGSLDYVPHSVYFFLEMVASGIWDNTMFLHHEQVEHVIAAAPIDYTSQVIKHHHLEYFGWTGLGYPEYHEAMPHKKYTLGFAGQGPTFYINTMDNSQIHGPDSQGHHLLAGDADPCFGAVVSGMDVVDAMIQYGMHQESTRRGSGHPWSDSEHTWTRLVKIEMI